MPQAQHPTIHKGNFIALFFYSFQYHKSSRLIATDRKERKIKKCLLLWKLWLSPLGSLTTLLLEYHRVQEAE